MSHTEKKDDDGGPTYTSVYADAQRTIFAVAAGSLTTIAILELLLLGSDAAWVILCYWVGSRVMAPHYGDAYAFRGGRVAGCYALAGVIGTFVANALGLAGNPVGQIVLEMVVVALDCALASAIAHRVGLVRAQTVVPSAVGGFVGSGVMMCMLFVAIGVPMSLVHGWKTLRRRDARAARATASVAATLAATSV